MIDCMMESLKNGKIPILLTSGRSEKIYKDAAKPHKIIIFSFTLLSEIAMFLHSIGN